MGARPKQAWRGKRVNWDRETTERVYAAAGQYWQSHTAKAAFMQAQEDIGLDKDLRRKYISRVGDDLTKLYGAKSRFGSKIKKVVKRRPPNGSHVEAVAQLVEDIDQTTAAITGASASPEPSTIETPPEPIAPPIAPIPAVPALSAPGSLDAAIAVIGKAFGGLIRDALADALTKALTNPQVAATFAEVLRPAIQPVVVQAPAPVAKPEPEPVEEPPSLAEAAEAAQQHKREREHLPRVLVAGLLPNQINVIEKEFAGRASLRFWKSSDAMSLLRKQTAGVDAAVGMVGFLGHSADHTLTSRCPTYIRASGGVTSVKNKIEHALKVINLERAGRVVGA